MKEIIETILKHTSISIVIILLLALLVFFAIYILLVNIAQAKNDTKIANALNANRIYVVDFGRDRGLYFDKSNFSRRIDGNLDVFFTQFETNAIPGIKAWLNDLLRGKKDTPYFYEADVNADKLKKTFFSLLQVIKVDKTKEIIYLESYLLKYLFPKHQINRRLKKKNDIQNRASGRVEKLFARAKTKNRGALMVVRFYKVITRQESDIDLEKLLITKLKDRITLVLNSTRVSIEIGDLLVGVFDAKANDNRSIQQLAHSISNYLLRYMKLNSIDDYSFTIGVSEVKDFNTLKDLTDMAKSMAVVAETQNTKIAFYDPNQPDVTFDSSFFRNELDLVIKEKKLDINFRPIVDVANLTTTAYLCYIDLDKSIFKTYNELKEFALKTNREKELFAIMARKVTAIYYNEAPNKNSQLFFPIQLIDRDPIVRSLQRINHVDELKIVMMLDEEDLHINMDSVDDIVDDLTDIKQAGFQLSLTISDFELTFPEDIYAKFDYFIVDNTLLSQTQKDERNLIYLLSALGKLLKYKKPIVVSDITTMSNIEYFIRAGIDFISSEEISKKSPMIMPIDKRKLSRLNNIKNKR